MKINGQTSIYLKCLLTVFYSVEGYKILIISTKYGCLLHRNCIVQTSSKVAVWMRKTEYRRVYISKLF